MDFMDYYPFLDRVLTYLDAIIITEKEYQKCKEDIRNKGLETVKYLEENHLKGIVLAGRPYHVDPEINHGIDTLITSLGLSVLTEDSISDKSENLIYVDENINLTQLDEYKKDVGQYMTFGDSGLTLGATGSLFKTAIDNRGIYFKQEDTTVSFIENNQLYIPNAVIQSTLILGNFFFSPRKDGGFSLTWQGET